MSIRSETSPAFWISYRKLDDHAQQLARKTYRLWCADPHHPSLHFKKIGDVWSVRVSLKYRAVGYFERDCFLWTWIGEHREYDQKF